jgi:hypothetical protein
MLWRLRRVLGATSDRCDVLTQRMLNRTGGVALLRELWEVELVATLLLVGVKITTLHDCWSFLSGTAKRFIPATNVKAKIRTVAHIHVHLTNQSL